MRGTALALLLATTGLAADTGIYRCQLDDGTIAFQEMPCPEPAPDVNEDDEPGEHDAAEEDPDARDDAFDFVNPFDEPVPPPPAAEPALPEPVSQDRAECEQMTRDAIDAIDLEMRQTAYTREQGEEYLAELLELTRQLRACKEL